MHDNGNMTARPHRMKPEEKRPVYDFCPDSDGNLVRTVYEDYAVMDSLNSYRKRTTVCIRTEHGTVYKDMETQMGRFLNGHFYTFKDDPGKAMKVILSETAKKLEEHERLALQYRERLEKLRKNAYSYASPEDDEESRA